MTHLRRRWKIVAIAVASFLVVVVVAVMIANLWYRSTERTYYGAHSDILRVGERVALSEDFRPTGSNSIAKAQSGIVREEPARDEDDCNPDRLIELAPASGELILVPRRLLHR